MCFFDVRVISEKHVDILFLSLCKVLYLQLIDVMMVLIESCDTHCVKII